MIDKFIKFSKFIVSLVSIAVQATLNQIAIKKF